LTCPLALNVQLCKLHPRFHFSKQSHVVALEAYAHGKGKLFYTVQKRLRPATARPVNGTYGDAIERSDAGRASSTQSVVCFLSGVDDAM
jgi:hypothetical protein